MTCPANHTVCLRPGGIALFAKRCHGRSMLASMHLFAAWTDHHSRPTPRPSERLSKSSVGQRSTKAARPTGTWGQPWNGPSDWFTRSGTPDAFPTEESSRIPSRSLTTRTPAINLGTPQKYSASPTAAPTELPTPPRTPQKPGHRPQPTSSTATYPTQKSHHRSFTNYGPTTPTQPEDSLVTR